jgi:hypothetical protein
MHAATSKVENSAQGSSGKLKFVHGITIRYYNAQHNGIKHNNKNNTTCSIMAISITINTRRHSA